MGTTTTENLIQNFLTVVSKGVGMFVPIDDVKVLQKDLQQDYIIDKKLSTLAGNLALRCSRLLAVASAALITTTNIEIKAKYNNLQEPFKEFDSKPDEESVKEFD